MTLGDRFMSFSQHKHPDRTPVAGQQYKYGFDTIGKRTQSRRWVRTWGRENRLVRNGSGCHAETPRGKVTPGKGHESTA